MEGVKYYVLHVNTMILSIILIKYYMQILKAYFESRKLPKHDSKQNNYRHTQVGYWIKLNLVVMFTSQNTPIPKKELYFIMDPVPKSQKRVLIITLTKPCSNWLTYLVGLDGPTVSLCGDSSSSSLPLFLLIRGWMTSGISRSKIHNTISQWSSILICWTGKW